jgi:hypothetical protein
MLCLEIEGASQVEYVIEVQQNQICLDVPWRPILKLSFRTKLRTLNFSFKKQPW